MENETQVKINIPKISADEENCDSNNNNSSSSSINSEYLNDNKTKSEQSLNVAAAASSDVVKKTGGGGSATGNPRNKCALKPGHSLMDWIRLGSSGVDLSGTRGKIINVPFAELVKHNKVDDAWLAIRGRVYNVTRYMNFHPGGIDELMKGVGSDATKMFEEVHAWVNYEQLLAKCFIGPLRNVGLTTIKEDINFKNQAAATSSATRLSPNLNEKFKFPSFKLSNSSPDISIENNRSPEHNEVIPRFDWIQKTSELTIIFYTKALCNPGMVIDYMGGTELSVRIIIENVTHLCKFQFTHEVVWPPTNIRNSYEIGKIELIFAKAKPELWTNYGVLDRKKLIEFDEWSREYEIVECNSITNDSYALMLKPKNNILQLVPLGYHLSVTARIQGNEVTRSYTPIPHHYLKMDNNDSSSSTIPLLVKSYSSGILSKYITRTEPLISSVVLSQPKGNFSLQKIKSHRRVAVLAAGSGITPMLSIIDYLLERTSNKMEEIVILLFNKKLNDIWCKDKLENLSRNDNRIKFRNILSEGNEDWQGERGRISHDIVLTLSSPEHLDYVTFCCVCGPSPFNDLTVKLLKESGFNSNSIHCFQG